MAILMLTPRTQSYSNVANSAMVRDIQGGWEKDWRNCYERCKGSIKCENECDKLVPNRINNNSYVTAINDRIGAVGIGVPPSIGGGSGVTAPCPDCPPDCQEEIQREQWYLTPLRTSPDDKEVLVNRIAKTCEGENSEIECDKTPVVNPTNPTQINDMIRYVSMGEAVDTGTTSNNNNNTYPDSTYYYDNTVPCDGNAMSTGNIVLLVLGTGVVVALAVNALSKKR